ncbi:2-isopropylmalate synthase [Candidatus Bathyarchaeota archaeon]|nr:MAG: 2-isopropylmalate synthase [Candidatus Bathyarchaeota archaeon]
MKTDHIRIFDTTLRDGEQTPGVALTPEDKLMIAKQLDKLGVDVIEAGFPVVSQGEMNAVKLIAKEKLKAEICGLARTEKEDIDMALKCDVDGIHIFIATSPIHLKHKLHLTKDQVIQHISNSVEYAKSHGVVVEFSAEDATRTELPFLKEAYRVAIEAGADRINVPDTVGVMTPKRMSSLVAELKKEFNIPISVHCHNDFGMAVANSLAGIEAGANQVHVTVNGIGERAGNASLEEVVMALYSLYREKIKINTKLIYETSRLVSKLTGIMIPANKPIVGENAFAHESGIHTRGVAEAPATYEPISPKLIGRRTLIIAGKHAGTYGLRKEIEELGFKPTKEQMKKILLQIKEMGDKGKTVTTTDLYSIVSAVCGVPEKEKKLVNLKDLTVVTGSSVIPTASVKLILEGNEYVSSETGVGPVDAAIKAVQKITDKLINVRLKEFRLEALTGGSDAVAEVIVKVEDANGKIVSARAAKSDIVLASVEAMINGLNRLLNQKTKR